MLRLAKRGAAEWGANRGNRANQANPTPSDVALAHQVAFQVTYGVGRC